MLAVAEVDDTAVDNVRAKMRCSIHTCHSGKKNSGGSSKLLAVVCIVLTPEVAVTVALPPTGLVKTLVHMKSGSSENGSGRVIDLAATVNHDRCLAW